jgi:aspartyl-tRNA(Asn)/glutamyl-tRNA(Gln) amidotransferase subunit B
MSTSSRSKLPELPDQKKARFIEARPVAYDASVLVAERESADFYETVLAGSPTRRATASSPPTG